jgi:hypothetical protein
MTLTPSRHAPWSYEETPVRRPPAPEIVFSTRSPNAWRDRAECRGASGDLFVSPGDLDDEPPYPSKEAQSFCRVCPVRAECLAAALALSADDDWGVRGGTSAYQRRQMRRVTRRRTCIGCGSEHLVLEGSAELCLSCGLSWFAG